LIGTWGFYLLNYFTQPKKKLFIVSVHTHSPGHRPNYAKV